MFLLFFDKLTLMKGALIVSVLIFVLGLFALLFPFKVSVKAHLNVLSNRGFFCVKMAFLTLICGRLRLSSDLRLEFESQKTVFDVNKKLSKRAAVFLEILLKKIDVMFLDFFFEGGKKDDAFTTALICGSFQVLSSSFFSIMKTKNTSATFRKNVLINFQKDTFALSLDTAIAVSLFDVLSSFVRSGKKKYKKV